MVQFANTSQILRRRLWQRRRCLGQAALLLDERTVQQSLSLLCLVLLCQLHGHIGSLGFCCASVMQHSFSLSAGGVCHVRMCADQAR
jgi:hypothetical protein